MNADIKGEHILVLFNNNHWLEILKLYYEKKGIIEDF